MSEENKKIVVENNNTNTQTQPIPIKKMNMSHLVLLVQNKQLYGMNFQ